MALYNIVSDQKSNRLIATKKSEDELKAPPGPRTAWEKLAGKKNKSVAEEAPATATPGIAGIQPDETPPVSPKKRKTQMFVRKPQ